MRGEEKSISKRPSKQDLDQQDSQQWPAQRDLANPTRNQKYPAHSYMMKNEQLANDEKCHAVRCFNGIHARIVARFLVVSATEPHPLLFSSPNAQRRYRQIRRH